MSFTRIALLSLLFSLPLTAGQAALAQMATGTQAPDAGAPTMVQLEKQLMLDPESLPPIDVMPASLAREKGILFDEEDFTHPTLKLTPDKSELVRLDREAGSVIIGNPNHLSIVADSAKLLVLVAKAPGATHFTVLDKRGNLLMQRHVIVASPQEKYIRVRRSCAGAEGACQATSVFYCPDMCHEIIMGGNEDTSSGGAIADMVEGAGGEVSNVTDAPATENGEAVAE